MLTGDFFKLNPNLWGLRFDRGDGKMVVGLIPVDGEAHITHIFGAEFEYDVTNDLFIGTPVEYIDMYQGKYRVRLPNNPLKRDRFLMPKLEDAVALYDAYKNDDTHKINYLTSVSANFAVDFDNLAYHRVFFDMPVLPVSSADSSLVHANLKYKIHPRMFNIEDLESQLEALLHKAYNGGWDVKIESVDFFRRFAQSACFIITKLRVRHYE